MEVMLFRLLVVSACAALCGACSCLFRPFPDAFCGQEILFRGKALKEDREPDRVVGPGSASSISDSVSSLFFTRVYTVRVDDAFAMPDCFKGNKTIIMKTHSSSATCGITFTLNKDAVFAGYYRNGEARTGLCLPNVHWDKLKKKHRRLLKSGRIWRYCKKQNKQTGDI